MSLLLNHNQTGLAAWAPLIAVAAPFAVIAIVLGWRSGAKGRWFWPVIAVLCWLGYLISNSTYEARSDDVRWDLLAWWMAGVVTTSGGLAALVAAVRRGYRSATTLLEDVEFVESVES